MGWGRAGRVSQDIGGGQPWSQQRSFGLEKFVIQVTTSRSQWGTYVFFTAELFLNHFNKIRTHILYRLAFLLWYVHFSIFCLRWPSRKFFPQRSSKGKISVEHISSCMKLYKHQSTFISTEEIQRFCEKRIKGGYLHTKTSLFKDIIKNIYFLLDYCQETILRGSVMSHSTCLKGRSNDTFFFQTIFWAVWT